MFGKSCKCKTKICKCGIKKIGGVVYPDNEEEKERLAVEEEKERLATVVEEENKIEILKKYIEDRRKYIEGLIIEKNTLTTKQTNLQTEQKNETRLNTASKNKIINDIDKITSSLNYKKKLLDQANYDLEYSKKNLQTYKEDEIYKNLLKNNKINGIYNFNKFTKIYCFSDIESNMPEDIYNLMFYAKVDEKYTPHNLVDKERGIVFTGDLIDRGAYTIRNLLNMLALKTAYPNNVVLICGNRDINKIRMYHECHIEKIESEILTNSNEINTFTKIYEKINSIDDIAFLNKAKDIAKTINIQGIVNALHPKYLKEIYEANMSKFNTGEIPYEAIEEKGKLAEIELFAKKVLNEGGRETYEKNFEFSYRDSILRIRDMYANTLGSPNQIKFFRDEFEEIFEIKFDFTDDEFDNDNFIDSLDSNNKSLLEQKPKYILLLKFIAMMNMVMGKIRTGEELEKLPECLRKYDGLYIKYLKNCHIMAAFTIENKDEDLYIASHSGIPYNNSKKLFYIPEDVGKKDTEYSSFKKRDIQNKIMFLNSKLNNFLNNDKFNDLNPEYIKYVRSSASCLESITDFDSSASPIVSSLSINKIREESLISLNSSLSKDSLLSKEKKIKKNNIYTYIYTNIYNIFGHQPGGFTPYVNKVSEETLTSYHINLDISKAENGYGISNKNSYVYLLINDLHNYEKNNKLIGKIKSNIDHHIAKFQDPILIDTTIMTNAKINFEYNITLDEYCKNRKQEIIYGNIKSPMFLVDNAYYGMFGFNLVKANIPTSGGKNNKTYIKSDKRFMNGKRNMVIYLGKRGCKYVKVKGEYISISKFIKTINKNKKVITKR